MCRKPLLKPPPRAYACRLRPPPWPPVASARLPGLPPPPPTSPASHRLRAFIRGSRVRFMIIPDMLKNTPMFKRLEARIRGKGSAIGVGRGRAVTMCARFLLA
ncbi:hypothetical protein GUJ93_ZPchr0003g16882 [Zizania palustris]|uniref:Uncharacterized protein n=1 Tax=Zizania palustris TaxID=103762 RepID=A0A8J5S9L7_ZIZPA|nr:hypothetical protein GUJ93_ZPchr0003g16882 [Zizania palustris]